MIQILVAEDDASLNRIVSTQLTAAGYLVRSCFDGSEALSAFENGGIDLVISDIMMPGIDGFELVENLRAADKDLPILLMTARDDMAAKQKSFRSGVDDYMVKPIEVDELLLRVGALLRRARIKNDRRLVLGDTVLDEEEMTAYVGGHEISLTVREFRITYKLLSYPKKTFSRAQLMDEFWDDDTSAGLRAVDIYITRIREKFSASSDFRIQTVHGLGYKAVPAGQN